MSITQTNPLCEPLLANIAAAGHWIINQDGVLITDNDAAVQAIIDALPLAQVVAYRQSLVYAYAKSLRDAVVASYSAGEMSSWSMKLAEATAYQASNTASTPLLSAEAGYRGCTVAALSQSVILNGATFAGLEAQIGGNCGKHADAIGVLTTIPAALAYDYSAGWPTPPTAAPLT